MKVFMTVVREGRRSEAVIHVSTVPALLMGHNEEI
jgi:hypothetical protein